MNTSLGKVLQVVPTSESVCWSPSGVICFTRQGRKDQEGRGSATDARVDREQSAQESSWTRVPCIEPAKPLVQVRDIHEVMSEVLASEHWLDLLFAWLTGTMTAVSSPDVIVGGIPSCVSCGGIQLVWHLVEPASEKLVRLLLLSSLQSACNHQALQPFSA